MMDRNKAIELVKKYIKDDRLQKHVFAVSACMKELAEKLGENSEKWELAGLLHDLDYDFTKDSPEEHGFKTLEILKDIGFDNKEITDAILAHCERKNCETKMEWALYTTDPTSGFIVACALMHPLKRLENIDLNFMKRRFKEKRFAQGANREQIKKCENLGLSLNEFLEICLKGMQKIKNILGL